MLKKCFFIILICFIYANAYEYYKRDEVDDLFLVFYRL